MRKLTLFTAIIALSFVSSACHRRPIQPRTITNYTLGNVETASIGDPMIEVTNISFRRKNVGIFNTITITERFEQNLIYGGRADNVIKVMYREFGNGYARQAFHQELQYDLKESSTISFREFSIEVIEANNSSVKFKVLSD